MSDDKTDEMFALYTKWDVDDDRVARCKFWNMVNEQFPETIGIMIHIVDDCATRIVIREGKGNKE